MAEQKLIASLSYNHYEADLRPLIESQLETLCPIDFNPMKSMSSTSNLGHLKKLPTELLLLVLEQLPLTSLIYFRNTNRRAHYIVETMPKFRIIVKQAPQAIRGILAVPTKVRTTLSELYGKLQQRHCDQCAKEGQYKLAQHLWLPTTERLCFRCAWFGQAPMDKDEAAELYDLSDEQLESIPSFRCSPAIFKAGLKGNTFKLLGQPILYDAQAITDMYHMRQEWTLSSHRYKDHEDLRHIITQPKRPGPITFPGYPPGRFRRDMATIVAPWISSGGAEMGAFCSTCLHTERQDTLYTHADFLKHLQTCRVQPIDEYPKLRRGTINAEETYRLKLVAM
jgi:hypothetical protein